MEYRDSCLPRQAHLADLPLNSQAAGSRSAGGQARARRDLCWRVASPGNQDLRRFML
jgi:hypothetical protein